MTDHASPISYASYLAGYISDPSTIRARVLSEYGRAPSVEQCRNLRNAKLSERKRVDGYNLCDSRFRPLFRCGHPETDDNIIIGINGIDKCRTCEERKAQEAALREQAERRKVAFRRQVREERKARLEREIENLALKIDTAIIGLTKKTGPRPRLATDTISAVAEYFDLSRADLTGTNRGAIYVDARAVVAVVMRERGLSFPQIGKFLNRHHTSIINLIAKFGKRAVANPRMLEALEALR
jgi:chromosomal replication initiator protein